MTSQSEGLRLELLFQVSEAINSAILAVSQEGEIIVSNRRAAGLFDTTSEDLHGRPLKDLFPIEDREILVPNIMTLTRTEGEFEGEVILRRKGGEHLSGGRRDLDVSLEPRGGNRGHGARYIAAQRS